MGSPPKQGSHGPFVYWLPWHDIRPLAYQSIEAIRNTRQMGTSLGGKRNKTMPPADAGPDPTGNRLSTEEEHQQRLAARRKENLIEIRKDESRRARSTTSLQDSIAAMIEGVPDKDGRERMRQAYLRVSPEE